MRRQPVLIAVFRGKFLEKTGCEDSVSISVETVNRRAPVSPYLPPLSPRGGDASGFSLSAARGGNTARREEGRGMNFY